MTAPVLPPRGVAPVFSPAFARDPGPTLSWLRDEQPLYPEPFSRMLVLTRHEDCSTALRDPGLSAEGGQAARDGAASVPRTMLNTDGPEHARLREPARVLLGPAAVRALLPSLDADVARCLDGLAARPPAGPSPQIQEDLAEPIATAVLGRLLGLDDEDDLAAFATHARAAAVNLDPMPGGRRGDEGRRAMEGLVGFLDRRVLARPRPGSPVAALVDDGRLDRDEVTGVLGLCVVGGWSPLADSVCTAVRVLQCDPLARRDAADPSAAESLADELLRWHTPLPFVARRATRPVDVPSGTIPSGAAVLIHLDAADHDPRRFPEPELLVSGRVPAGHLAFGAGAHFCLGAPLVRSVLPLVLRGVVARFPSLGEGSPPLDWRTQVFPRAVVSAPLFTDRGTP